MGSDSWSTMEARMKAQDEKMIKDWNDEIDTLMVFAGLFSAVLTAFNIESYRKLLPDSSDTSLIILQHISQQISSFSLTSAFANSTIPPINLQQSFTAPLAIIRINVLWFTSLVLSLVSASLGMLVKQWLREYLSGDQAPSRNRSRVRQFRHEGLTTWRVFEIMALLPTLLQISLILFLVGLIDFLRLIHPVVASVVSVFIGVWLLAYFATTFLPIFSAKCPYKSPQARLMFNLSQILSGKSSFKTQSLYPHLVWARAETGVAVQKNLEVDAIATADATLSDDDVLGTVIRPCLETLDGSSTVACLLKMVKYRLYDLQILTFFSSAVSDLGNLSDKAISIMVSILLDTLAGRDDRPVLPSVDLHWILEALSFVKKAILASKNRLATSDSSGSLIDIDVYISRSLHKVLGMGLANPVSDALTILSLRAKHTAVKMPTNATKVNITIAMPMILILAKHMLAVRHGSDDALGVNPFSVLCAVLCILEKLPKEWFYSSPKELRDFLGAAESIIPQADQRLPLYMNQCEELAKKLNDHVPGIADGILNTLKVLKGQ
ncbi:hypothetical protein C8Q75DRAFT_527426 [Abortiporus biennis]|nr:hypothetical protein C8Q75DRAFT_527426 [Abortiporus biennis]